MGEFIQHNSLWITPILGIVLTIVLKIASKPDFLTLNYIDYLDFGFDLAISAIICLVTGMENDSGIYLLLLAFILLIITSTIVHRIGWNKQTNKLRILGVLIPDFVGIFLLVLVTLYIGGVI